MKKSVNNIIDKILSEIDEYRQKEIELDIERDIAWGEFLKEKGHEYNTPTSYSIKLLKYAGINHWQYVHTMEKKLSFLKPQRKLKKHIERWKRIKDQFVVGFTV